jgi:hypothetical protein
MTMKITEEYQLLECDNMQSSICLPMFRREMFPPSSGLKHPTSYHLYIGHHNTVLRSGIEQSV